MQACQVNLRWAISAQSISVISGPGIEGIRSRYLFPQGSPLSQHRHHTLDGLENIFAFLLFLDPRATHSGAGENRRPLPPPQESRPSSCEQHPRCTAPSTSVAIADPGGMAHVAHCTADLYAPHQREDAGHQLRCGNAQRLLLLMCKDKRAITDEAALVCTCWAQGSRTPSSSLQWTGGTQNGLPLTQVTQGAGAEQKEDDKPHCLSSPGHGSATPWCGWAGG